MVYGVIFCYKLMVLSVFAVLPHRHTHKKYYLSYSQKYSYHGTILTAMIVYTKYM